MNISIRGDKLEITDAMQKYAKEKLLKLDKYFENPNQIDASVLVKVKKITNKVEVTIPLKKFILRAEEEHEDFYAAIDIIVDKLERQIRKNKTRLKNKRTKDVRDFNYEVMEDIEEDSNKIVKRKKIEVKPMDEEEAILQMELLGHEFYLYKDASSEKPVLIYKRKDGNYGIIETE